MKTKNGIGRKLRYGSLSVGISAAVIVAVLVINILASVLCSNAMIFTDMTTEPLYTLGDETEFLLEKTFEELGATEGDREPAKVDIIFCADPDLLTGSSMLRPIYYMALQLQKSFPDRIRVDTRDVWDNPSSVDEFMVNA